MRKYRYSEFAPHLKFRFSIHVATLSINAFDMHTHEFSELVVILGGTALHLTESEAYTIGAGDVFVLNGDTAHGFDQCAGLKLCNIAYDPAEFLGTSRDLNRLPGYHALFVLEPLYRQQHHFSSKLRLSLEKLLPVAELISTMEREFTQQQPGYEALVAAHFMQLVVYLSRQYSAQTGQSSEALLRLAEVVAHMEQHFDQPLRLDDLAAQACLSPNQFLRVFRRAFALSPMQHLIHLRVARACELLRGTDWSISEIAYSVGFHDSNYFTRQFRRITGQTPGAFRRGFSHWQGERDTNRGVG